MIELQFDSNPANPHGIASFDVKWDQTRDSETRSVFPEDISPELVEKMQRIAVDAFDALRLRDYARIDLRLNDQGEAFVIEVNPNCYLEKSGEFARAAERSGLAYPALVERIIELASARYAR